MSIEYEFKLYREGTEIADLVEVQTVSYGYARNKFKKCLFSYNANSLDSILKSFLVRGSEFRILRKGELEDETKLVWAGEIIDITKKTDENGENTLDVVVENWGNIAFQNRLTSETYSSTAEEQIAWGIVNATQVDTFGGTYTNDQVNFGIQQGVLDLTGNTRDRTYDEDLILTALQQLADVRDQGVDPDKLRGFRVTPDLVDKSYLRFFWESEYGQTRNITYTEDEIKNIQVKESNAGLSNRVTAVGKDNIKQTAFSTDATNLDLYKMRQSYVSKTNIETTGALLESAEEELDKRLNPTRVVSFETVENDPFIGLFREGDFIGVNFENEIIEINSTFRVYEIDITYDDKKRESSKLKIAEEKPITTAIDLTERLVSSLNDSNERLTNIEKFT